MRSGGKAETVTSPTLALRDWRMSWSSSKCRKTNVTAAIALALLMGRLLARRDCGEAGAAGAPGDP
jgi:hypothetical protein